MNIQILNSFRGDANKEIDTASEEGRAAAAKLIGELIRSGSAIFLEREVDGETKTYRVTGYDQETDRLKITLPVADLAPASREDPVIAAAPIHPGRGKARPSATTVEAHVPSGAGRAVSVAPVSGGLDDEENKELSWAAVRYGIEKICEERGWHHGCPMPSAFDQSHRLIVAKGAPLGDRPLGILDFGSYTHICRNEDLDEDPPMYVNSWTPAVCRTEIYRDSKGTMAVRIPYTHSRLMMWLDTMKCRAGAMDWETELTAMRSLQEKLSDGQWRSYMLSGMFPEKSPRSGVTYILRKGMPTIAITERPRTDGDGIQIRYLAALCLHPLAYYDQTWAGSQPPSDEVIAHLMLIRSDEHFFWRKSGQHAITAPQAAI